MNLSQLGVLADQTSAGLRCSYTAQVWSWLDERMHTEQLCDRMSHGYATWYFKLYCTLSIPTWMEPFHVLSTWLLNASGILLGETLMLLPSGSAAPAGGTCSTQQMPLSWGLTTTSCQQLAQAEEVTCSQLKQQHRYKDCWEKAQSWAETLLPLLLFNDTYKKDLHTWDGASSLHTCTRALSWGTGQLQSFGLTWKALLLLKPGWQNSTSLFLWEGSQAQF